MLRQNYIAIGVSLLIIGVGGIYFFWPTSDDGVDAEIVSEESVDASVDEISDSQEPESEQGLSLNEFDVEEAEPTAPIRSDSLEVADRFLLGGNYARAYELYENFSEETEANGAVQIRLGVAAEFSGNLDKAREHYSDAVESNVSSTIHRMRGLMGIARVWEKQELYDDAIKLLSDLYLVYAYNQTHQAIKVAIFQQLTRSLQKRILASVAAEDSIGSAPIMEYIWAETPIEEIISDDIWLRGAEPGKNPNSIRVIQNPGADLSLVLVDAHLANYPSVKLLEELETQTGIRFRISNAAMSIVSGRAIRADVRAMPVASLIDQVFARQSLMWRQDRDLVEILHVDEVNSAQRTQFDIDRVGRLYQQMQFTVEHDGQRAAMLMNKANNSFIQGDLKGAELGLDVSQELRPAGELAAARYFNAGQVALAQQSAEVALKRFYQALDQTLLPRLQAKSYAMVALLELNEGRPEKAITAASRGLRITDVPEDARRSLMVLAKAYILNDDPLSASRMLHKYADVIDKEPVRRLASVYGSYARYQITKPQSDLQDEGQRLVLALAAIKPSDATTFVDHLVLSRAFHAVGFRTKSLEHLTVASDSATGDYWPQRIRLSLVEMLFYNKQNKEAINIVKSMPPLRLPELEEKRLILLASIEQELGNHDASIQACRWLLRSTSNPEPTRKALQLLGTAYRNLDRPYAAALCFAGLLPDENVVEQEARK